MRITEISSKENPVYRNLKKLLTSKGIKEDSCFLLMGEKLIQEFIKSKNKNSGTNVKFNIKSVITFDEQILPILPNQIKLKKDLFNEIDILGTHYPFLLIEFQGFAEPPLNENPEGLEIVSPLGDPKNMGALIRSALGFGASKIILTQEACHPYLPQTIKASAGAVLNIPIYRTQKSISEIQILGDNFALDLHGQKINQVQWPKNIRLWIGEEGPGLQLSEIQKKKIKLIHIPTNGIESLNATVSAVIAIWEWKKTN